MYSVLKLLEVSSIFHQVRDREEKEMETPSSILAWRIPWGEEPGGLLSIESHRVGHDWSNLACMHALEKEMATHSSILAWRIPGTGEPGGLPSMGSHKLGHDWSDLATAARDRESDTPSGLILLIISSTCHPSWVLYSYIICTHRKNFFAISEIFFIMIYSAS